MNRALVVIVIRSEILPTTNDQRATTKAQRLKHTTGVKV
jgi:hypothetical protein